MTTKPAILITGSAKRLGREMARHLAKQNYHILIHYNQSEREAKSLQAEIGTADIVKADLTKLEEAETLIPQCLEHVPYISAIIHNASLFLYDDFGTLKPELWYDMLNVHITSPTFISQAFLKQLPQDKKGVIIPILDQKIFNLNPDFFSYTIAKFGLYGLCLTLARKLAPQIRVCGIAPGLTLKSYKQTEEDFLQAFNNNPLQQGTRVADLLQAIDLILTATSMTGQIITIDGGEHFMPRTRDVSC